MEPRSPFSQDETSAPSTEPLAPEPQIEEPQPTSAYEPIVTSEATPDIEPASAPPVVPAQERTAYQPQAAQSVETPPAAVVVPPKNNKKKMIIIGAVVACALALTSVGSALAYNLWYQNPDKVIIDSVINLVKAKSMVGDGEFTVKTDDASVSVKLDTKTADQNGYMTAKVSVDLKKQNFKIDVSGEAAYIDDAVYLKVNDLEKSYRKVVDTYIDMSADAAIEDVTTEMKDSVKDAVDEQFMPIINKIDNKWIKISSDDLKDVNKETDKTRECVADAVKKLQEDSKMSSELVTLYRDNKFVLVDEKLGSKDGSLGYSIDIDQAAAKSFGNGFAKTTIAKELTKCDDSFDFSTTEEIDNEDTLKDVHAEVWIDRWSHQLTQVSVEGASKDDDGKFSFVYNTQVNKAVSVEAPKDFVTLKQLQDDLSKTFLGSSI